MMTPLTRSLAALALLLLAGCVAGGPRPADPLETLLAGKTVIYGDEGASRDDTAWQVWRADGTTTYTGKGLFGGPLNGRWKIDRGRYCSVFEKATEWTCYRVTTSDGDRQIRFRKLRKDLIEINFGPTDFRGYFVGAAGG